MASRRELMGAVALAAALAGCSSKRAREAAAKDLHALAGDQCLIGFVGDKERDRLEKKARGGEISQAQVDAYIDDVRAKKREAEKVNASVHEFCRVQRGAWRAHFGRYRRGPKR